MAKKINWHKVFNKLNQLQWNPIGATYDSGVNCFSIILVLLNNIGYKIPISDDRIITGDYTYDNVLDRFEKDNKRTVKKMTEYLLQWVKEILKKDMRIGDILLLLSDNKLFPVIYSGNMKFLTITPNGTYHIKISNEYKIIRVYRGNNQ